MKSLFLKNKPCAILLLLKDPSQQWYPGKLARESRSSYVHTVNLLARLKKEGIVSSDRKGRQNNFLLTEKGLGIAAALDEFARKCEPASKKEEKPEPPIAPVVQPEELAKIEKKIVEQLDK